MKSSEHSLFRQRGLALDAFFGVEQVVRSHYGMFMNFNGSGGLWRRAARPAHPLQQAITDALVPITGAAATHIGIDGCGAPVMAVSLAGLARAFGRIATGEPGTPEARLYDHFLKPRDWANHSS